MGLTLLVTKKKIISSNPFLGELIYLEGKVNFEAGKYTEKEAAELNNAKEIASIEKILGLHFCGKFKIKDAGDSWEVYNPNSDGTMQRRYNLTKNLTKGKNHSHFTHYVRVFAENMRLPYSSIDEIAEIIRLNNDYQSKSFFLKPCFADDGKQGIEIAMTRDYGVNFNLKDLN